MPLMGGFAGLGGSMGAGGMGFPGMPERHGNDGGHGRHERWHGRRHGRRRGGRPEAARLIVGVRTRRAPRNADDSGTSTADASRSLAGVPSSGKEAVDLAERVAELKTGRGLAVDQRTHGSRPAIPKGW